MLPWEYWTKQVENKDSFNIFGWMLSFDFDLANGDCPKGELHVLIPFIRDIKVTSVRGGD